MPWHFALAFCPENLCPIQLQYMRYIISEKENPLGKHKYH
jgi:hypothetical protein